MKNIALVLNSKYLEQAIVFLNSLFLNNSESVFKVFIINSSIKQDEIDKINIIVKKYNNFLVDVKVKEELFKNAPILWSTHSREAYYKLVLPLVIPKDVKKILYFDVDMIINGKIDSIYDIDLKEYSMAAVKDYFVNKYDCEYVKNLGIEKNNYFNSGMVLFNLENMRKNYDFSIIEKYIEDNAHKFHYHDQEVLNALFKDDVKLIDEKYNHITKYKGVCDFIKYKFNKYNDVIVIHYAGNKPWNYKYYGKFYKEFWKYIPEKIDLNLKEDIVRRNKSKLIIIIKTFIRLFIVN